MTNKSKKTKRVEVWVILNDIGNLWSKRTWRTEEEALACYNEFWSTSVTELPSNFSIARAIISYTVPKKRRV